MIDVDFVILWVDGQDPTHQAKRAHYLNDFRLHSEINAEQSTSPLRFNQTDELKYCLRSIKQHAPWYRKIWLVVDKQFPQFLQQNLISQDRIEIIDHEQLFSGYETYLPSFNTRAIASLIGRIPQLSEHFIYANDDFMFGHAVDKSFFFQKNGLPVTYGDWVSFSEQKTLTLFQQGVLASAQLEGFKPEHHIMISHGFQPMTKSLIKALWQRHPNAFLNNLHHKFRHESQFLVEALLNHYLVGYLKQQLEPTEKMVHFSFELCRVGAPEKIQFLLNLFPSGERVMFCLNEFQSLYPRVLWVKAYLDKLCGPALLSEKECELPVS
ncbi:stealth family protein [Rheinheimera sp.]|uniref:stealth family protein n=1 Tax=Rheinheimera sp. TaxID=1869214 RepID=UPI00260EC5A8|nr:stealth family protein [Rheinheimera sp.]MCA1929456.1 Stealth CR1 domain-containing protein [Rheinheimera sp.]